ncbi:MAG TPA: hypothetical protein VOA88_18290 [Candidatus Dormibacteraeota bacterium]|nr:hypothetical protein [Candidatus Dormibacteraeota bacterium]
MTPVFDTSAILNLSKRHPSDALWPLLNRSIPAKGCPLSFVTVLELFLGLRRAERDRLTHSLKALTVASRLSRRKVLLHPIAFVEKELFGIRSPGHERSRENLKRWLGSAMRPNFESDLISGTANFVDLEKIENLFIVGRKGYIGFLEQFLDRINPGWRVARSMSGSALSENERDRLKRTTPVGVWKRDAAKRFLECIPVEPTLDAINTMSYRCDANLTLTVSVLRDVLMTNYRFEENWNDFNDEMQLLYLSRPSYCFVTEDARLIGRVKQSSQSSRILTIDQFVSACGLPSKTMNVPTLSA